MMALLMVLQPLQSSDGSLHCAYRSGGVGPGNSSYCFHSGTTVPNAHTSSLHLCFATEEASVFGVLADFNFLHYFPKRGIITGPVFAHIPTVLMHFARSEPREQESIFISTYHAMFILQNLFPMLHLQK